MQNTRLNEIRAAEACSHMEVYTDHELYAPGSWLSKPVRTVLELLPHFNGYTHFRGLDLGCGVGRNSIAVAQALSGVSCCLDCVDILELAILKLRENARKYDVSHAINGIRSSIDAFCIRPDTYDLIMAVSALEHMDRKETFLQKLTEIKDGTRINGIVCLIINTNVTEIEKLSGTVMPPQFEVDLSASELDGYIEDLFAGWHVIKHTVMHQRYDIPRGHNTAVLDTDVVTYVIRKEEQYNGES